MLQVAVGEVRKVIEQREEIQLLEVDCAEAGAAEQAIFYCRGTDCCTAGDQVMLNVTAVRLGLGTGGYHFVIAKLSDTPADYYPTAWGHIVKMRYAPYQLVVDAVEEQNSPWHHLFCNDTLSLQRTPVIIAELHSLLPAVALSLKRMQPNIRLVYVMPDGACLPIAFSRHVRQLKQLGLLTASVTTGHAWGGDLEAVNLQTGLLAAKHIGKADVIVCILGPGVVGTGTAFGFSGLQTAEVIHSASLLGGIPIFVPRISFSDQRARHRGISHHTRTVLRRFALLPSLVAVPRFGDDRDLLIEQQEEQDQLYRRHYRMAADAPCTELVRELLAEYPEAVTTMGRDSLVDPSPVQTAYVASRVAHFTINWFAQGICALSPDGDDLANLAKSWSCLTSDEA